MKHRLSSLAARARELPPAQADRLLAGAVLAEGAIELIGWNGADGLAGLPVAALVASGYLIRRRRPILALVPALAGLVLAAQLPKDAVDGIGGPYLALIFLVFSMAMRSGGSRLWAGCALTYAGALLATLTDQYPDAASDPLFVGVLLVAAPAAAGRLLRSRTALTRALREKAEQAERERDLRAEEAVRSERTRIAGELHDVVAHALGAMTVQAAAARRLADRDPVRASDAFLAVENTGREALTELRRLLGVLRRDEVESGLEPQPRLEHLADLVRRVTAAGLPVSLDVRGSPGALPAGVDLAAYRVVQEALGAALRTGGAGRAEVHVSFGADDVVVEVIDDGRDPDRRLLGMRERIRVYGGELEDEAQRGGGHRVRARLPLEAPA